jgi:hypothetical protein
MTSQRAAGPNFAAVCYAAVLEDISGILYTHTLLYILYNILWENMGYNM